ncbi:MAG: acetyltransferase family protein [Acidimicrobiales bacterium]|nr:acetyltransferase family protein [Acidimicrobiales bacterium]
MARSPAPLTQVAGVTDIDVVALERVHLGPLRGVLTRAFADDPLPTFVATSDRRRPAVIRSFLAPIARDAIPFHHAYAAVDRNGVRGVAAWLPPGAYPPSLARQLRQLPGLLHIAALVPRRMSFVFQALGELARTHPKEPHWYLALLAVDPSHQGRGIGRKLIAPVLQLADTEGLPAYLETTKAANVAWYRGAGFDVVDELHVGAGPPIWTMQREPR